MEIEDNLIKDAVLCYAVTMTNLRKLNYCRSILFKTFFCLLKIVLISKIFFPD